MTVRERIRTHTTRVVAATVMTGALIAGGTVQAQAATGGVQRPDLAAKFVQQINTDRAHYHHRTLAVTITMTRAAQRWAATMAGQNRLYHNPRLASSVSGWCILGENVGVGYSVGDLKHAFWQSRDHRANMLYSGYTRIGVSVVRMADGKLWVAEEFERPC